MLRTSQVGISWHLRERCRQTISSQTGCQPRHPGSLLEPVPLEMRAISVVTAPVTARAPARRSLTAVLYNLARRLLWGQYASGWRSCGRSLRHSVLARAPGKPLILPFWLLGFPRSRRSETTSPSSGEASGCLDCKTSSRMKGGKAQTLHTAREFQRCYGHSCRDQARCRQSDVALDRSVFLFNSFPGSFLAPTIGTGISRTRFKC